MSSESLIITVGASVGVAIAALGNVENKITRLGEASARLTSFSWWVSPTRSATPMLMLIENPGAKPEVSIAATA